MDIVAEGDVGQLQALKEWCTQGPPSARVSDVRVTESEASVDGFRDFQTQKKPQRTLGFHVGGERGIRTLDTLLTYTHFPGVRLQPLGHLSNNLFQISNVVTHLRAQTLMNFQAFGNCHRINP